MANKKTQKKTNTTSKSEQVRAKTVSKNNKIRRTVMGTLSGVFMASAIIVAAIPVPKAEAVDNNEIKTFTMAYSVEPEEGANAVIPSYGDNDPLFFDSTGLFGSAYVARAAEMTGVVAYYDTDSLAAPKDLVIPENMPAFQYDQWNRLCAVSGDTTGKATGNNLGKVLCFCSQPATTKIILVSGNEVEVPDKDAVYSVCLNTNMDAWEGEPLYECTVTRNTGSNADVITLSQPQVPVEQLVVRNAYIGSTRYILKNVGDSIEIKYEPSYKSLSDLDSDPEYPQNTLTAGRGEDTKDFSRYYGVFQGSTNFKTLEIPENILAIGQNAFRNCSMTDVSIGVKIHCIGNNAFRDCLDLGSVSLANGTSLENIGDFAFAGCANLRSMNMPNQVKTIGSGAFMSCTNMSAVNLYGFTVQDGITSLQKLGDGVFYNCSSLERVYLPNFLQNQSEMKYVFKDCVLLKELRLSETSGTANNGEFDYTNVRGCYSLNKVTVPSRTTKFDCGTGVADSDDSSIHYCGDGSVDQCVFGRKNLGYNTPFPDEYTVADDFMIISYRGSFAYSYACEHEYAVGYLDPGYEGQYERVVNNYFYTVNDQNELIKFGPYKSTGDLRYVVLPSHVGNHYINSIGSNTFQGNDKIEYVFVPYTVKTIADKAFKDCVNLQEVEFEKAANVEMIGDEAFKTNCTDENKKLIFVGEISDSSVPFAYAMTPGNNYNDPDHKTKYISYTSEFPYNLQVELQLEKDPTTGEIIRGVPTLVDAPDYDDFASGSVSSNSTYSLTRYDRNRDKQNNIVNSAYTKYQANKVDPGSRSYSENEEKVINAVFRPVIPEGIKSIKDSVYQDNDEITQIVMNGVEEVPANAFKDCDKLTTVVMKSSGSANGESIGDQAFADCPKLTNVTLPSTLTEMGKVPFYCSDYNESDGYLLEKVDFSNNPNFEFESGIIYENLDDGTQRIVECLPTRGYADGTTGKLKAEEFENVSVIDDGAFKNCTGVTQAVFGESPVSAIPNECFENCTRLNYAEISPNTRSIGENAFSNTALSDIKIPAGVSMIAESAFTTEGHTSPAQDGGKIKGLNIQCEDPSTALEYAKKFGYGTSDRIKHKWTVKFYDYDNKLIGEPQLVEDGSDAVPPDAPKISGYTFKRWRPSYKDVTSDLSIYPEYAYGSTSENDIDNRPEYTVTFYNYDGTMKVSVQSVKKGDGAITPATVPEREGYTFTGWLPEYNNVISDLDIYPQYKKGSSADNNNSNNNSSDPTKTDPNNNSSNNNSSNNSTDPNKSNSNSSTNNNSSNNNKSNSSTNKNSSSSSSSKKSSVSNNGAKKKTGTKVEVTKTGIYKPDLITATVNGSTDDYVVKISDSTEAKSLVEQALLGEFGSLDAIRYFAMDISLYDKTGTTKILNTQGLTVTVTMPIPEGLLTYGGNNKPAAVSASNTLEKLEARFVTIDGVPCISFVCTHFSPYTIYVDLNNLTATGYNDITPTTGDPIHPKWFLSIGLAIMSVLMFTLKGSKRKVVKVIS